MSVGETLALARQERGLGVEDVSTTTRIRAGLIRQIEADDFSGCGGGVYARGHIRSLARAVGLDAEALIAEFDREHASDPEPALVPTPAVDPDAAAAAEGKRPNWTAAMAAALVVICVLAGVSLVTGGDSPSRTTAEPDRTQRPVGTSPSPSPSRSTAPAPPDGSVAHLPDEAIALVRVNSSQTWMSVETLSGRLLFQGLLSAGQRKVFRDAKGLRLTIGNAPVVNLVANGQDVGVPRSQGNVAHVTITTGGDVQYA